MNTGNQHQMVVKNTFPTGAQEWYCPTCGRHFIIQWPPNYKRIVLDEGDEQASHTGGAGGVSMGLSETKPEEAECGAEAAAQSRTEANTQANYNNPEDCGDTSDLNDPYLGPWASWMNDKDL